MNAVTELFAWAVPAWIGALVDHTWVTTYDNRKTPYPDVSKVANAGQFYWYCWGSFDVTGGSPGIPKGYLGKQSGDLGLAKCLVQANVDCQTSAAARGTIFIYGVNGVCHQLANQALYATGTGRKKPLTVSKSNGYWLSLYVYGTYGWDTVSWANKLASCGAISPTIVVAGPTTMPNLADEFEERAREMFGDDPKLLDRFLALRAEINDSVLRKWPGSTPPSAETLNARNQALFEQAAILLGRERFRQFFGFEPDQKIDLVDPRMLEAFRPPPNAR
jgi:hypothetical protein